MCATKSDSFEATSRVVVVENFVLEKSFCKMINYTSRVHTTVTSCE